MYTGSHLKLILAILLIPSVFIFLIAADSENRNFNSDSELTVEKISLTPIDTDINLPTEDKILIRSGDTFYSTLMKFDVSPATINKIGKDRKLKKFISLQVNDQIYITSKNGLVCLAGFMRILSPYFIKKYKNRILNIHPALLPAFPGLDAQKQAIQFGAKVSGCTVHVVDEGVDTGPIILQEIVKITNNDTEETLSKKILAKEHKIYPKAVELFAKKKLSIKGRNVKILN